MEPRIATDVPAPAERPKRIGRNMKLLLDLAPGSSAWWPESEYQHVLQYYRAAKSLGIRIEIHKVAGTDPEGAGVRLWRW